MKTILFRYLQPATLVAIVMFWALVPDWLVENSWSIVIVALAIKVSILSLEWVNERHASWRLDKRELATDLFYVILGATAISWCSRHLAREPLKGIKDALGISTEWAIHMPFLAQVALVVVLVEFGQYWMHRLMHNQPFFWSTHAPHHHITQLNALKGAVGNPIELFLIGLSVVALFDLQQAAIFCAANIIGTVAAFAHANVRFDPPRWYAFVFTTVEHHSLHHSVDYEESRSNYANALILCDRVCGTFREGEAEVVGQDDRRRLSVWEQFVFPFQPLIAKIKARRGEIAAPAG